MNRPAQGKGFAVEVVEIVFYEYQNDHVRIELKSLDPQQLNLGTRAIGADT